MNDQIFCLTVVAIAALFTLAVKLALRASERDGGR